MENNFLKAYSFFMMPFYIREDQIKDVQRILSDENSVWKRSKMNIEKGILYSHIQEFLSNSVVEDKQTGELPSVQNLASHDYLIYSLSQESERFKGFMDSSTEHAIIIKKTVNNKKELKQISFRFKNTEKERPLFFSPKLVICPNAQVGLLLFSIEMTDWKDIESLSKLNYALFKTYKEDSSQTVQVYHSRQAKLLMNEDNLNIMRKDISKTIQSVRKLKDRLKTPKDDTNKKNIESLIASNYDSIREKYSAYKMENDLFVKACKEKLQEDNRFTQRINDVDQALGMTAPNDGYSMRELLDHNWTMRQLTESLMSDLKGKYDRADDYRLHVFTYLQVDQGVGQYPQLLSDFSRIIRCQDQDYLTLPTSNTHSVYEQMFENVYVGSTVEGGGVLTILQGAGDDFMKSFDNGPLTHSYLWVYILVIMQRHTLLQMSRELAEEYGYSGNDLESRLEHLRQLMRKMSKTKINTYFTDVSDHSHLNALYSFCCRNLAIDRYFADVDNKLATLKETLEQLHDEKIVELEQRQKQEQEEQTKIQEARLKLEKENDRRQQNITKWIGVVAVILTLFSALSDSYDLFGEDKLNWIPESLSSVCHLMLLFTAFFIVGAIAWKIIEDIQKENRSQDND